MKNFLAVILAANFILISDIFASQSDNFENLIRFDFHIIAISDNFDNAAQSAYHAIALAEEAYFAQKNEYTDNYKLLEDVSGLVIDKNLDYGYITVFTPNDKNLDSCFKFSVSHKKTKTIYNYNSCNDHPVSISEKTSLSSEIVEFDNAAQSAYHAVALAEEAYFAQKNEYTDRYRLLKDISGLVIDNNIDYSNILIFKANVKNLYPCYKFRVSHKKSKTIYTYNSCNDNPITISEKMSLSSEIGEFDNAAQSAYHAVALAEEAYFALKNEYTDSYKLLKDISGLAINNNVDYSNIIIFKPSAKNLYPCYKFSVSHKKSKTIYTYNSCNDSPISISEKTSLSSEIGEFDNAAQSAYHAVALAEEAYYAQKNEYTDNYKLLAEISGLALDNNIDYSSIKVIKSNQKNLYSCYKFSVSHKKK
jgi:Tfp pilus assembly protein PilE